MGDPYDFIPKNVNDKFNVETAEKFKQFAAMNQQQPETIEEFEKMVAPDPEPAPHVQNVTGHDSTEFFTKPSGNPLQSFFRTPEMYVTLPSKGRFNNPGDFDLTVDGQMAIYPMTAQDEMLLKTPDALLNGATLTQLLNSCAPGVKNIPSLPSPDFDVILLAIRSVSFGEQIDYDVECQSCKSSTTFGFHIPTILDTVSSLASDVSVDLGDKLVAWVKPFTFELNIKAAIVAFDEAHLMRAVNDQTLSDTEKLTKFNESFIRIYDLNMDMFSESITKIVLPTGEEVTEISHIREFLNNVGKTVYDKIDTKIKELNIGGFDRSRNVNCSKCDNPIIVDINYDPTRFFV